MVLTKIKIATGQIDDPTMISWKGRIVGGTEKTLAITRPALWSNEKRPLVARKGWTVTHVPTGCYHACLNSSTLKQARRKALKFYKILAKHGVAKSKAPLEVSAKVRDDCRAVFK